MMKKTAALLLTAVLALSSISAAFVPVASDRADGLFSSPALAIRADEDIDVGWLNHMGADFSALSFMADPVKGLDRTARFVASELAAIDDMEWWKEHQNIVSVFSSIDPENFPTDMRNEELALYNFQKYFREHFLSDSYGAVNRAHAASLIAQQAPELFPADCRKLLGGDLAIVTGAYGRHAHDGFAWKWDVSIGYRTAETLLRGKGALTLESGVNAAYAFNLFSPNFSLGISARPSIIIDNLQLGPSFISARMEDSAAAIFSEPMRFGTGIALDIGFLWEPSDTLSFTLDFRNAPSFRSYFEWDLTELAEGNLRPSRDRNIYYEAPDIALSSIYAEGPIRFKAEVAHIMDQLLWKDTIRDYEFNYYEILDLSFAYDMNEDLTLMTELGKEKLSIGVEYKDFTAELTTKLDRGYLGLTVGCAW